MKTLTDGWSSDLIAPANLLEVVVLMRVDDEPMAIHAMSMRTKYRRLLEP